MVDPYGELALTRILTYLEASGLEVTREVNLAALRLVQEALEDPAGAPLEYVMERIRERFNMPAQPLPPAFPAINRGSIGYDDFG